MLKDKEREEYVDFVKFLSNTAAECIKFRNEHLEYEFYTDTILRSLSALSGEIMTVLIKDLGEI
ncbi:MAG: hypothetical protein ABFD00_03805 [Chloroherpetonaceae bacterium]